MTALKLTMLSGFALSMLGACGIRGDLKTPPPVFGSSSADPDRVPTEPLDEDTRNEGREIDLLDDDLDEIDPDS